MIISGMNVKSPQFLGNIPQLRPYQSRDVERIRYSYQTGHDAPLYVAPCGSGKTVLFACVCEGALAKGNTVGIICHRVELIDQISKALTDRGIEHGFIANGYDFRPGCRVYVCSVFTLIKRLALFRPSFLIFDEAHHVSINTTWGAVIRAYPEAKRLGVTATPVRTSGEGLGAAGYFDDLIIGPEYEELTNAGYLTPLEVFAPPTISTKGLHTRAGDYIPNEVVAVSDKPTVTGDAIDHYQRLCAGRRAIVFDVSVEAATKRAEAFRAAGIPAESIDGQLDRGIRADRIRAFREGSVRVLTSCDLVSEGLDLPAIEVGISLRPTQSLTLWLQQTGRILRPMAGKTTALLFDHTGNCLRHGFPTEQRDWTLDGVTPKTGGAAPIGVRVCPKCFAVSRAGTKACVACKTPFKSEARVVKQKEGKLEKVTPEDVAKALNRQIKRNNQWRAQSVDSLVELYYLRHGRKDPGKAKRWAQHIIEARQARGR